MKNKEAIIKLGELIENLVEDKKLGQTIDYEILDIDRQLAIHIEFPTELDQYNIVFPRKFFKEIKEKIGLELLSFEMISPEKDSTKIIDYLGSVWVPFPSIEIVFENPDVKEEDIEKLYVTQFGEQLMTNE